MAKKKSKGKKPGKKKSSSPSFPVTAAVIVVAVILGAVGGVLAWYVTSDTASGIELPDFVYEEGVPPGTEDAYQVALDIPDYLDQIPCFCGCGTIDGHKNNLDCFIKSRDGDKVEWDDHGAG